MKYTGRLLENRDKASLDVALLPPVDEEPAEELEAVPLVELLGEVEVEAHMPPRRLLQQLMLLLLRWALLLQPPRSREILGVYTHVPTLIP